MSEYTDKMTKAIEATEREFSKIRAGQASPAILNDVRIDYYGTPTPISQVAKISVPEPRMLLVSPWEKTMVDPIDKAILAANIGLTPMKDGNCIRVSLPILTTERRQELAKIARKHAEEGRVAIRNIRRDANDAIKKNKEMPEDEVKKQQDEIQKATDKAIAEIARLSPKSTVCLPKRKRTSSRCSPGFAWQISLDMSPSLWTATGAGPAAEVSNVSWVTARVPRRLSMLSRWV